MDQITEFISKFSPIIALIIGFAPFFPFFIPTKIERDKLKVEIKKLELEKQKYADQARAIEERHIRALAEIDRLKADMKLKEAETAKVSTETLILKNKQSQENQNRINEMIYLLNNCFEGMLDCHDPVSIYMEVQKAWNGLQKSRIIMQPDTKAGMKLLQIKDLLEKTLLEINSRYPKVAEYAQKFRDQVVTHSQSKVIEDEMRKDYREALYILSSRRDSVRSKVEELRNILSTDSSETKE